ncbi:MAG: outer membrane lipoprotein-sorting protein [Rhodoferax sp.]|uniref:outer membrane lipoprotein-sorting protein n=1 Tax=Rhodoferax sp. TaxID=50421 RepID=UPI002614A981|nr:outer membrane lipoprotein-sorting protein [Rhodoferax sp.]MDD2882825.1 outer membrane lipoprotein-sorting protein [Rhodoferax sp.]
MTFIFKLLFTLLVGVGSAWAAPSAEEILAASDAIRNPGKSFSVTVTLTEFQAGKQVDTSTLTSYSRTQQQGGDFASLIRFVLPARDAGKLMLKNGNDMWFYDPTNKASVRLSPQQRLLGQASNGDVATVNFAKDYKPMLVGEEEIQDGERRKRMAHKLLLTAVSQGVTYASIEMWVDAENNRPLKARFFAESTRLLKTAYYRRYQLQLGAERPTETVIIDGLNPQSVTIMRLSDYVARTIPDTWMQRDFLPRFQPD